MALRTTNLIIALLLLNAVGALAINMGLADDLGAAPNAGSGDAIDDLNQTARDVSNRPGGASQATLLGLIITSIASLIDMIPFVFDGPKMLISFGVPAPPVTFFFSTIYVVVAVDIISARSGRDI